MDTASRAFKFAKEEKPLTKEGKQPLCRNTDGAWNQEVQSDTNVVVLRGPISSTTTTMGYLKQG
jgi:hypothetical protein